MKKEKETIKQELSEILTQYYDGSFARLVSEYIHATRMTKEEVETLVGTMKKVTKYLKEE